MASEEFVIIRDRLTSERFLDSWQEEGLHFFVFQLRHLGGEAAESEVAPDAPVAVFVMHPESDVPVSAVVVTTRPGGDEAEVRDLRAPDVSYVAATTT